MPHNLSAYTQLHDQEDKTWTIQMTTNVTVTNHHLAIYEVARASATTANDITYTENLVYATESKLDEFAKAKVKLKQCGVPNVLTTASAWQT